MRVCVGLGSLVEPPVCHQPREEFVGEGDVAKGCASDHLLIARGRADGAVLKRTFCASTNVRFMSFSSSRSASSEGIRVTKPREGALTDTFMGVGRLMIQE